MKKGLVGLMISLGLWGQTSEGPSTIAMSAPTPSGVTNIFLNTVGVTGQTQYCYWVVTVFPIGMAQGGNSICTSGSNATLSGGNYNGLSWNTVVGATGYWVIRSSGSMFPGSGTVAVNTTILAANVSVLNDQSNTLHAFTFTPANFANVHFRLDNGGFSQPRILVDAPQNITLFANLPTPAQATGLTYLVTDSNATTTCNGGGGSGTPALCWSTGAAWTPLAAAVTGGTTTIQTNGVNNTSQNPVNFTNSAAFNGLTFTFNNPSGGVVRLGASGTLDNSGLTNSGVTINTTSPLAGGGAVALGGAITLTCAGCGGSGGGNVSNSGTPLIHQIPIWISATAIKGLGVGGTNKPLVGLAASDPLFSNLTLTNPATSATLTVPDGTIFTTPPTTATGASLELNEIFTGIKTFSAAPIATIGIDLGTSVAPFRNLYIYSGGTFGTSNYHFVGTPTASRAINLPNLDSNTVQGIANPSDTNVVNYISTDGVQHRIAGGSGSGTVTVVGSGNLTSTAIVTGGGTQLIQTPNSSAQVDSSGNISTPGSISSGVGSGVAGVDQLGAGTATAAPTGAVGWMGPASVSTPFFIRLPSAPTTGFLYNTGTTDPSVMSFLSSVTPALGGTGVVNGSNNTLTYTGNYTLGLTLTGNTALTLPTSGSVCTTIICLPISGGTLTGALLFTDNTLDIGATGATRPRTIYLGTSLKVQATTNQEVFGTSTNLTTLNYPAPSGAITLTYPITTNYMLGASSDTTVTHILHATAVAGVGSFGAEVTADLPVAQVTRTATFTDIAPVTGDDGLIVLLNPATAVHLTRISCGVSGTTSVIVNLVKSATSLISDMTATAGDVNTVIVTTWANGSGQCGGTSSCAVAAHAPVTVHIGTVSGTPTSLSCSIDYTVD